MTDTDTRSALSADEMMINIREVRPDLADVLDRAMLAETREEFAAAVDDIALLPAQPTDGAWLTVADAAEVLGVGIETVRIYIRCRELRATKIGRAWRIRPEALAAFIESKGDPDGEQG